MQRPVLAANWKMHYGPGEARAFMRSFLAHYARRPDRQVILFPPAVSLTAVLDSLRERQDIQVGVQNIHWEDKGAFTGELSAPMARDAGADLVLVGHSERRHVFGETEEQTALKVAAAVRAGLVPMLCVGEKLEERERGETELVVLRQLRAGISRIEPHAIASLLLAYDPARRLANLQVTMTRALVNAQMVYDILDLKAREPDSANAKQLIVTKGEVRFDKVDFAYDADNPVLRVTSFVAKAGETTAIVGPSGSGKSTIANLILRFYDPANGAISIDGTDIKTVTKQSLRNAIAYVSQAPYMFEGSIRDNIRFGRADATDAEVEDAAKLANAHNFIVEQPNGYDTEAGENGTLLSGGQRQRISIARAMLRNAPILLLDEATSSLDNESERLVQQALETAMKGRTTIVIAHRLSTIIHANKIITLMDGQIAEEGTHDQLVHAKNGIYARFFAMQNGKQIEDKPVEKPKAKRAAKGAPK